MFMAGDALPPDGAAKASRPANRTPPMCRGLTLTIAGICWRGGAAARAACRRAALRFIIVATTPGLDAGGLLSVRPDGCRVRTFSNAQGRRPRQCGHRAARRRSLHSPITTVEPDWVASIVCAFGEHPEADAVGGRVLPVWPADPPDWLTRDHWTPLAILDRGDAQIAVTLGSPICLVGANLSVRRPVFDVVGAFAAGLQRVKDWIGSLEGPRLPAAASYRRSHGRLRSTVVCARGDTGERLERAYHRRWHTGHGPTSMRCCGPRIWRQTRLGTFFGVPATCTARRPKMPSRGSRAGMRSARARVPPRGIPPLLLRFLAHAPSRVPPAQGRRESCGGDSGRTQAARPSARAPGTGALGAGMKIRVTPIVHPCARRTPGGSDAAHLTCATYCSTRAPPWTTR